VEQKLEAEVGAGEGVAREVVQQKLQAGVEAAEEEAGLGQAHSLTKQ